jgi:hypothetical protein
MPYGITDQSLSPLERAIKGFPEGMEIWVLLENGRVTESGPRYLLKEKAILSHTLTQYLPYSLYIKKYKKQKLWKKLISLFGMKRLNIR